MDSEKPRSTSESAHLTRFLSELGRGDAEAEASLMPQVQEELRLIAGALMRRQRSDHTLQPTELVSEAYLKLFGSAGLQVSDRKHFYRLAARAMRQLLVDHARRKKRLRRGGEAQVLPLDEAIAQVQEAGVDWSELDEALEELARLDEREARVVELRYFGGLEMTEISETLGASLSTVERDWRSARAWLARRVGHRAAGDPE